MFVTAGFIVGFDSENGSRSADAMVELIEEAAIPVCMVGLLYALPNTQLTRRLEKEGRLHPFHEREDDETARTSARWGSTSRPCGRAQEILADYVHILERVYDPVAYAGRLERLAKMLGELQPHGSLRGAMLGKHEMLHRIMANMPEPRELFGRTLTQCAASNPAAARRILILMTLYMDVGPFSRDVIAQIENMIAELGPVAIEPRAQLERASATLAM